SDVSAASKAVRDALKLITTALGMPVNFAVKCKLPDASANCSSVSVVTDLVPLTQASVKLMPCASADKANANCAVSPAELPTEPLKENATVPKDASVLSPPVAD